MSKKYSAVTKFEKTYLMLALVGFLVLAIPMMILLDSPYRSGEEISNLVKGNFFHPIKIYITLGFYICFVGMFGQFAGPFDLYYRSETSERYFNWKLITLLYVVIFCCGLGLYYYGGFFLRRELLGQEISVYHFFQDFFFPSESVFENIFELLLAFIIGFSVINKAWEELSQSDCFLEIDDDFIAWKLPRNRLTADTYSSPSGNIARSSIEQIAIRSVDKGRFKGFIITTDSQESYILELELINTFESQMKETLRTKYASFFEKKGTEPTTED